jgi:FeS assembly SUF system regulator
MIRLSRLADYAVVMMTHMAAAPERVHTAVDVAGATSLPVPTVSKILATLARHDLLTSHRGAKGGYTLASAPHAISVAQIVGAVEGPIALTQCIEHGPGICDVEAVCPSRRSWHRINSAVQQALQEISLAELAAPALPFEAFAPPPDALALDAEGRAETTPPQLATRVTN